MSKLALPILLPSAFFSMACCQPTMIPKWIESKGSISASRVPDAYVHYEDIVNRMLVDASQAPVSPLRRIGHVVGAYREYAIVVGKKGPMAHGNEPGQDVVPLIGRAIRSFQLDSVELDVHAAPTKNATLPSEEVVVVHNEPKWSDVEDVPAAAQFLGRNTLKKILAGFLDVRTTNPRAKAYVEIKAPTMPQACEEMAGSVPAECLRIGRAVARVVKECVPAEARESIAFISFWPRMLESMHEGLVAVGENADVHDYILILGPSSALVAEIASVGGKGTVPQFDAAKKEWLAKTAWVDGVWASPVSSKALGPDLASINVRRQSNSAPCLRVGISVYQSSPGEFEQQLRSAWHVPPNTSLPICGLNGAKAPAIIESLIYDIDTH